MARYDLAPQAAADLREIVRHTRQTWGVEQARRYREELEVALQRLSLTPNMGRRRDEIVPAIRSFRVAAHIAFYVQRKNRVTIVRILHPSMDADTAFAADEPSAE